MSQFFKKNFIWLLILLIFLAGLTLRAYRLNELLGFYYDQARDGLVIRSIIVDHKLTLIGPTSGIEGIFLGPFYYYLLVPAYLVGRGDPAVAASFVGFVNSLTIIVIFLIGRKLLNNLAGLFAALLFAFSWESVGLSRWFANPSPLPFFASLILLCLINLKGQKTGWWLLLAMVALALSLQLEAASAIWFIPAIIISLVYLRVSLSKKWWLLGLATFILLSSAQVIFDLKHNFLISKAFYNFLVSEKSFKTSFWQTVQLRIPFYFKTYSSAFAFEGKQMMVFLFGLITELVLLRVGVFKELEKRFWRVNILLIWILSPLVGFLFYQGNNGYVWSYYLSGTLPAVYLLAGLVAVLWFKKLFLAPLAIIFLFLFLTTNIDRMRGYLLQGPPGENTIDLMSQKQSVDFIYQDAKTTEFNVDVYVPPVIPYTYDYLFVWYGKNKYGFEPKKNNVELLYTLEEADPPHPERLKAFIDRQNGFSKVVNKTSVGGITIEKRVRTAQN